MALSRIEDKMGGLFVKNARRLPFHGDGRRIDRDDLLTIILVGRSGTNGPRPKPRTPVIV